MTLVQLHELLELFAFDWCDELWWRMDDELSLYVRCSDTFAYACADLEQITPDDLPALAQAKHDAIAVNGAFWWPILWVARKRQKQPVPEIMHAMKGNPELYVLFNV